MDAHFYTWRIFAFLYFVYFHLCLKMLRIYSHKRIPSFIECSSEYIAIMLVNLPICDKIKTNNFFDRVAFVAIFTA